MQERASGLGLGWDRSCFVDEDCVGRGVIDLGVAFPLSPEKSPILNLGRNRCFVKKLLTMPPNALGSHAGTLDQLCRDTNTLTIATGMWRWSGAPTAVMLQRALRGRLWMFHHLSYFPRGLKNSARSIIGSYLYCQGFKNCSVEGLYRSCRSSPQKQKKTRTPQIQSTALCCVNCNHFRMSIFVSLQIHICLVP